jgi:salicylate hydroxylase
VETLHKGNIALLGDAGHATSPHYGQGAGMSIEDAYVLSNLLARSTSPADLPAVFAAYDQVRVPRTMRLTEMSREQGKLLDFEGDELGDDLEKIKAALQTRVR